jgi:hypothetical protein
MLTSIASIRPWRSTQAAKGEVIEPRLVLPSGHVHDMRVFAQRQRHLPLSWVIIFGGVRNEALIPLWRYR